MSNLVRFGVSLEKELLQGFDSRIKEQNYTNRSEAIRDLIREDLVRKAWQEGKEIAGAITMIYDHHKREVVNKLMDIQHGFGGIIISTSHIHLDHHNCLEVVVLKGKPSQAQELSDKLKAVKWVKHVTLSMSSTGRDI
ncbi:MAG: nickel-responsive transcriptional regulator NikR [Candidatus Omnitrophica bacterium]|nr:nickel-responsive transcriptional regulator NikR [Candidatus Omnitrophota bacterium]MBU1870390.1 nickel-responsive transcriptional regulator NikR [Candidatus Omnitrophota bacterium]